ncbi:MAG: hypothetical protein JZU63_04710 [Rhodoferax sp.]|nr:hypothetical protein [Rhodoferax sp.]
MQDIDTLLAKRAALQDRVGALAYRYTYGWEAMPVTVGNQINAVESEIGTVERALHAIYAQRGMLKPYKIHRTLPSHLQAPLRTQLARPMIFPDQDRRVLLVHPMATPLVYRFDFPFVYQWHELRITCHVDNILATLEAMPTVQLYGEDY